MNIVCRQSLRSGDAGRDLRVTSLTATTWRVGEGLGRRCKSNHALEIFKEAVRACSSTQFELEGFTTTSTLRATPRIFEESLNHILLHTSFNLYTAEYSACTTSSYQKDQLCAPKREQIGEKNMCQTIHSLALPHFLLEKYPNPEI